MYTLKEQATHYAFFDIEIDGKDSGRINFELYGKAAPKTVNNFLAFCSGDFSPYMKYKDSSFHRIVPGKFIKGGDFLNSDGTGAATVYNSTTIDAEKNNLKFIEPYLLAASSNSDGKVGSQFFITLDSMKPLNGSDHTIFGRVIQGTETVHQIEGIDDLKKLKQQIERNNDDVKQTKITKEVELNGFKIAAVDDQECSNNLLFLHGLLGQGRNWRSFALNDIISAKRNVYLVDLRNHGESDHHMSMTYREMADDVLRFADSRNIEKFSLLGHNLGAKTAMTLACQHPDRVSSLISIDTAPKNFIGDKQVVKQTIESIQKIKNLNIEGKTRKTAMDVIQQSFKDPGVANFVASNLVYDEQSERKFVKWCVNFDSILLNYENIIGFDDKMSPYRGPTLFLNGSLSVKHDDVIYRKLFPNAQIEYVEGAGHYVHTDKPKIAVQQIAKFLENTEKNSNVTK